MCVLLNAIIKMAQHAMTSISKPKKPFFKKQKKKNQSFLFESSGLWLLTFKSNSFQSFPHSFLKG